MADGHEDSGAVREVEERLARLPKVEPRTGFRDELRRALFDRAVLESGTSGVRPSAAAGRSWRPVLAAAAAVAVLIGGLYGGLRLQEQRRLAALPKLPAPVQILTGVGGRWPPVREARYELAATLPASPKEARGFAPKLQLFTADEARALAKTMGFTGPLINMGIQYRFEEVPGAPELGRLLDISNDEARVIYNDYRAEPGGAALTPDQAPDLGRTGLLQLPADGPADRGHPDAADLRLQRDRRLRPALPSLCPGGPTAVPPERPTVM
ncbi:MAG TPA: hypothetical protein VGL40_14095, partial [Bacillota bacterium]